jgi:hypothetical protein
MSCEHDCPRPPSFPRVIHNRPALPAIDYRIGDYTVMRKHMLDALDKSRTLASWTHRGADDPGIALLESAAVVGDILTFYQRLYANEAYLRTARWRESVAALVQLTGYRLAPGVGGEAVFAVAVKGKQPVQVPVGFGFKAQLDGVEGPAEFESTKAVTAHPALGRFHFYRPRLPLSNIPVGLSELELHAVAGQVDATSLAAVELREGDRLMLVPDTTMFDAGGGGYNPLQPQARPEILVVAEVETVLDRVIVRFKGALTVARGSTVRAYKIDRSFRHFGHNVPRVIGRIHPTTGIYTPSPTHFQRRIWGDYTPPSADADVYSPLRKEEIPLDTSVDDLAVGGPLICEGFTEFTGISTPVRFTVVKTVTDLRADSLVWGGMSGSVTVLEVDSKLIANDSILNETADIRRFRCHQAVGPELTLRAPTRWTSGSFTTGQVNFYGRYEEAKALAERDLLLQSPDGSLQAVRVVTTAAQLSLTGRDAHNPWMWTLILDQPPEAEREAFDEAEPHVVVYGNLIPANEGKTEPEAVLGNGDRREIFQTFPLPKAPLTYLLRESETPAQVPELTVWVDGIRWRRVETFFNSGPSDQVYVVREDDEGNSYVQFGDGKTGARLPSGLDNVVARFRTGSGARGPLEPDAKPHATGKLKELDEVFLPGPATGGGQAESADNAREAAPAGLQSLGRLVGMADIEAEALALPGVLKARAYWAVLGGVPRVCLAVLTEGALEADTRRVQESMNAVNQCRGPSRYAIKVVHGLRQYLHLALRVGYAAERRPADMRAAIHAALGIAADTEAAEGLFALSQRRFAQDAHLSQLLAVVQQVAGVRWVEADAIEAIPLGTPPRTDPRELAKPAVPGLHPRIACPPNRVLALHDAHFDLNLAAVETGQGCAA